VWKTSDWLIQEIGLAVGRNMRIILFLEEGVRPPGGLYGNMEFIPFLRDRPRDSFDKLLQMLAALNPRQGGPAPAAETKPAVSEDKTVPPADEDSEPKPEWSEDKYNRAAFRTIFDRDDRGFAKIDAAYRGSVFNKDDAIPKWEAGIEYMRLLLNKEGDLGKLRTLAEQNPKCSKVFLFLARGYLVVDEYKTAGQTFEQAAELETAEKTKVNALMQAGIAYQNAGMNERALAMIESAKKTAAAFATTPASLSALLDFAKLDKNDDMQLAILEQIVALEPTDISSRFSLAYKHGECDNEDMALHHYLRIPKIQRNATTWNNLGVSFEHFKMPVKSIEAYRISEKEKETLAMANLGFKLLSAGFLSEAKALCEQALEIPDRHKNIGALWNRLNEVPDEEDEELRKLQEKLGDKASFYRRLGEAASAQTLSVTTGKWETPDGPLEATTTAAGVRIFGTVQLPENSLIAGLVGTLGGTQRTYMQTVEYQLRFRGQMAFGTVKRVKEDARPMVFDAVSAGNKVLLYFEGADILRVMEQPNSVSPSFYAIKRLRE
jgi:tetratricopeptide (TPR) repeat protein